jgi:hypothetical protein
MAGRDLYNIALPAPTSMTALIEGYVAEAASNEQFSAIVAGLQHYLAVTPGVEVKGLEQKFAHADRKDQLAEALILKERAYQKIMKFQFSQSAQEIFAFLLAELHSNYQQIVWPQILAEAPRTTIDSLVLTDVLNPALARLEKNPLRIYKDELRGLLFFLTGNCWINWKP